MKSGLKIALIAATLAGVVACSKGGTGTDGGSGNGGGHINNSGDTTAPVLTINTPAANQVFSSGNVINISGRITDDAGLYRGSIRIVNDATSYLMHEQLYEIHGVAAYNFTNNYTVSTTSVADYTVTVFFEDHGNNSVARSVKIKVNP